MLPSMSHRHPPDSWHTLLLRQDAVFRVLVGGADLRPVRTVYSPDGLKVYRTPDDAACVALQARQPLIPDDPAESNECSYA